MPRNKVSYKPVRYFPRKKIYNSSRSTDHQMMAKEANFQNNQYHGENKGQSSQMAEGVIPPYPINNILVLPQNSDTLINVISPNKRDFSYKKYFRRRPKGKNNSFCKNDQDSTCDIKPDIKKLNHKNAGKSNINRHIIILSDSDAEDDVNFERTKHNENTTENLSNVLCESVRDEAKNNTDVHVSTDDDVILIEDERANDIIEIDDCNTEQNTPEAIENRDECNALLSTPDSSASNDFLESSQVSQNQKFNFSLHGSEFKDSEFLRPTTNVDISESGSISSVSDISNSLRTNVFNLVDFPKEKDNLFDENNLEKFKNSITPQRHAKKTIIDDNTDRIKNDDRYRKKQLPTLSDIGTDNNKHKRERGRSVIRELVNDRAYVLLSSAEKKMKSKKRKSKDSISNSLNESDVTNNTSPEISKKKKRKKMKKKDVSLMEGNDSYLEFTDNNFSTSSLENNTSKNKRRDSMEKHVASEICADNTNIHSNRLMIRTDLFSDVNTNAQSKSENDSGGDALLKKLEITTKQKKNKKDKSLSVFSDKDEYEQETLKKSERAGKKNIPHQNDEQIEFDDEVNMSLIEKKRKRKKESRISEEEIVDSADVEISTDVSKRKTKRKRLSENQETDNSQPADIGNNDFEGDGNVPEKCIKQELSANSEIPSVLQSQENLPPLINISESLVASSTGHEQSVAETGTNITNCKGEKSKENEISQVSKLEPRSEINEVSLSQNHIESNIAVDDIKPINKLEPSKSQKETNTYNENLPSVEKNCTDSKETIRTMLRDVGNPKQLNDDVESTKSISSEVTPKSSLMEESKTDGSVAESLAVSGKVFNKILEVDEFQCSTKDTRVQLSHITPTCKLENIEIVSPPIQTKSENLGDDNLHVINQTNVLHIIEENKNTQNQLVGKDHEKPIEHIVKVEPKESEKVNCKERQESRPGSTAESNLPVVSVEQQHYRDILGGKEKLPDVIEKFILKKDSISSIRKLCEYLEEVNDPQDVLKKVSMLKEAFLAKSVGTEVNSPSVVEETVSEDDDILSVTSDASSLICIESDNSDVEEVHDITLINCGLTSTPVKEKLDKKEDLDKGKSASVQNNSEKDRNLTKVKDVCRDTRRHETSSVPHVSRAENYKRGLDKYDVEDIQQFMSDDQKLWEISSEDLPQKRFVPRGKRCIKCKEIGHLGHNCPNKANLPKCILCGVAGHLDFKCPNKICTQCGVKTSIMKSTCQNCKHYRNITCNICKMRGHPRNRCPDLWRRYHLTVEHGPLVKSKGKKLKEKLWCSFCAKSGHLEYYCYFAQKNKNFKQLDIRIHSYEDVYDSEVKRHSSYTKDNRTKKMKVTSKCVTKNIEGSCAELSPVDVMVTSPRQLDVPEKLGRQVAEGKKSLRNRIPPPSNNEVETSSSDFILMDKSNIDKWNIRKTSLEIPIISRTNQLEVAKATTSNMEKVDAFPSTNKKFVKSKEPKIINETSSQENLNETSFYTISGTLESFTSSSSDAGVEGLPPEFVVIDETS